jgi:hypothetical protein
MKFGNDAATFWAVRLDSRHYRAIRAESPLPDHFSQPVVIPAKPGRAGCTCSISNWPEGSDLKDATPVEVELG